MMVEHLETKMIKDMIEHLANGCKDRHSFCKRKCKKMTLGISLFSWKIGTTWSKQTFEKS